MQGRFLREYLGTGPDAELIAELDRIEQERRTTAREVERSKLAELQERLEQEEREAARASRIVQERLSAVLEASGYHRHDRGQWRRTRAR